MGRAQHHQLRLLASLECRPFKCCRSRRSAAPPYRMQGIHGSNKSLTNREQITETLDLEPPRRSFKIMVPIKLALLFLLSMGITGCGTVAMPERMQDFGQPPDHVRIILRDLEGRGSVAANDSMEKNPAGPANASVFANRTSLGRVEISDVAPVLHNTLGPAWLSCIRSFPAGKPATDYAIFIKDNKIADVRTALPPDDCGPRQYRPLVVIPPPPVSSRSNIR